MIWKGEEKMVEFIKNWASGIIVAVIIATIIEMVLPENKNKKYIKTVIGIYVLFTIISPIISNALIDGKLDIAKYEDYLTSSNTSNQLSTSLEIDNTKNIQNIYQNQLKEDIKTKLKAKGFQVNEMRLEIVTEEKEGYGGLKTIDLKVSKIEEDEENRENSSKNEIHISKIEIGNSIDQTKNNTEATQLTEKQKNEIKDYLVEEYGIKKEKINIG